MANEFREDELLFRGVSPKEEFWKEDHTKVSSAAFKPRKDEQGVSVDRQDGRSEKEAVEFIRSHLDSDGLAKVPVSAVHGCGAVVEYDPSSCDNKTGEIDNPYHAQIYGDAAHNKLSKTQAKKIACQAVVVGSPSNS